MDVATKYEFNGIVYSIGEDRDVNGVVTYSCVTESGKYPVFLRTNGITMFHYKLGEDGQDWECCTGRYKLVQDFTGDAGEKDEDDLIMTRTSWNSSANALLYYMRWLG